MFYIELFCSNQQEGNAIALKLNLHTHMLILVNALCVSKSSSNMANREIIKHLQNK